MSRIVTVNRVLLRLQNRMYSLVYKEYVKSQSAKILEVGCGENPIQGVNYPTDIDESIQNPNVTTANTLLLPFEDKEFDLAIARNFIGCFDCIGRSDLKEKAKNELQRVAKVVMVREFNKNLCPKYWKHQIKEVLRA